MFGRILVPIDGSTDSRRALEVAATAFDAEELIVFHVLEPYDVASVSESAVWDDEFVDRREDAANQLLGEFADLVADHDVDVRTELGYGPVARTITEAAGDFDVDHIVIGSRGRRGVTRVVLGSTAESVAKRAPVSVTIVRPDE